MTSIILLSINFGKRSWKLWKRLVLLLYESNNLVPRAFPLKNGWGGKSCYRIVLRLKFIVTVELLYDQAESDFVQCQTKMRAFASRICSEFKQIELNWNRIVHQNALWSLTVFSTTRPWNKQISASDASQPSSQERWQVAELKHFKISYIFSLPRIWWQYLLNELCHFPRWNNKLTLMMNVFQVQVSTKAHLPNTVPWLLCCC